MLGRGGLLEIGAARLGDLGDEEVGQRAVEIIAAQSGVSMGGQDLKDAVVELENGKVEGAATQVVHRDLGVFLELVETVGERRRRRLIDDALDLESGQFSGAQGGVSLGVIEIGRNGDDRTIYGLSQRRFRIAFELL